LIVPDLMMPKVNGFDVVQALELRPDTAGIPIPMVTVEQITSEDRARPNGYATAIMEKVEFDLAALRAKSGGPCVGAPIGRLTWRQS
jgi:CheY-like chemotaxis protein